MSSANRRKEQAYRTDQICDAFEQSWREGKRPAIEELLIDCEMALRGELLRQLVLLEMELRQDINEMPAKAEYDARFPDDAKLIDEVFRDFTETASLRMDNDVEDSEETLITTRPSAAPAGVRSASTGKYTLLEELGKGGMGVVYKARDKQLERFVAIKMIRAGIETDAETLRRFRTEAKAIAQLKHPNIAQILEIGEWDGDDGKAPVPFFALEFAEGGSLDKRLRGEPQPARRAAAQVKILADTIQAAHDRGLVHRDLKPANVLIAGDDRLLITDFGLVKRIGVESSRVSAAGILGTPSYMAPEQASRGAKIGPPADIYALGAILYEMLTGRPPFKGATILETVEQVCNAEVVPPRQLQPACPRDLDTICSKCLEKSPIKRYASAAELSADLQAYLDGKPIMARPVGLLERGWMWAKHNVAVAVSLLLGIIAAMALVGFLVRWVAGLELHERNQQLETAKGNLLASNKELRIAKDKLAKSLATETVAKKLSRRALNNNLLLVAHNEWENNNAAGARQLLEQVPEDLRHFEWHYLKREFHPEQHVLSIGAFPAHPPFRLAFSPDGNHLACADNVGSLFVFDLKTGKRKTLGKVKSGAALLRFSPDGRWLAARAGTLWVQLWDWRKKPLPPPILTKPIGRDAGDDFVFDPDGKRLFLPFGKTGEIAVYDSATGNPVAAMKLAGMSSSIKKLCISPDRKLLATVGSGQAPVELWDYKSGALVRSLAAPADYLGAKALAFSADGKLLFLVGRHGFTGWDVASGKIMQRRRAPIYRNALGLADRVAFSDDGPTAADARNEDHSVRLFGKINTIVRGHTAVIFDVTVSRDGKRLASGGMDRTVRVWDLARYAGNQNELPPISGSMFTSDGRFLGINPRRVKRRGKEFTPGLWDIPTGRCIFAPNDNVNIGNFAVSRDGKYIAATVTPRKRVGKPPFLDQEITVWETATRRQVQTFAVRGRAVLPVQFSADGVKLVVRVMTTGQQGQTSATECHVFDCRTGNLVDSWTLSPPRPANEQDAIELPDIIDYVKRTSALAPGALPLSHARMIFTPDGKVMARSSGQSSGKEGYSVEVWDLATRTIRFKIHNNSPFQAIAFSPDGQRLAIAKRGVELWDVGTGGLTLRIARPTGSSLAFSPDGTRLAVGANVVEAPRTSKRQEPRKK